MDKGPKGPRCQSCGMPMTRPDDYGTNEDGSNNDEYCTYCYQKGRFTDEGVTIEEKIEKNVQMAVKMGWPEDKAREMANNIIPTLKRWKK